MLSCPRGAQVPKRGGQLLPYQTHLQETGTGLNITRVKTEGG